RAGAAEARHLAGALPARIAAERLSGHRMGLGRPQRGRGCGHGTAGGMGSLGRGGQAAVCVALMEAQGDGRMDTASGAPQAYPSTPGLYNLTTQADGHTVYYTLRIPAGYDGHTAIPVILCLHFGGQPTEFYGGRFLNLIPVPGLGSLTAILVAPTAHQRGWATPTGEAAACAALAEVEQHLTVDTR